ncbi:MAG: hypothetical protein JNM19_11325 [Chitinophagaceae bacterium]|nr:hypothetical protein [Chitinophagaceae bacterium]
MTQRVINITGNAINIGDKAAIVAENIGTYYIADMHKWNKEWVNRRIQVIGDLEVRKKDHANFIKHPVAQLLR